MSKPYYYKYDDNLRVYADPETGKRSSGPIYRLSFRKWYLIGETKRSYLLSPNSDSEPDGWNIVKVPLNAALIDYGFLTKDSMEADIFVHENRYELSQAVLRANAVQLIKIKAILEDK